MLQELGFHVAHVQPGSYHIYERDSAGDGALRLGSPGILYLSISTCSSVRGSNLSFTLAAHFRVIPFFSRMVLSSVMVSQKVWTPLLKVRLNAPEENLLILIVGVGDSLHIVVCFCLHYKYNTSAANTTIKCWKNSRETIKFLIVPHLSD